MKERALHLLPGPAPLPLLLFPTPALQAQRCNGCAPCPSPTPSTSSTWPAAPPRRSPTPSLPTSLRTLQTSGRTSRQVGAEVGLGMGWGGVCVRGVGMQCSECNAACPVGYGCQFACPLGRQQVHGPAACGCGVLAASMRVLAGGRLAPRAASLDVTPTRALHPSHCGPHKHEPCCALQGRRSGGRPGAQWTHL